MNKFEILASISELEKLTMDLHRKAGLLDELVTSIRNAKDEGDNDEYRRLNVRFYIQHYRNGLKVFKYDTIDDRVNELLEKF